MVLPMFPFVREPRRQRNDTTEELFWYGFQIPMFFEIKAPDGLSVAILHVRIDCSGHGQRRRLGAGIIKSEIRGRRVAIARIATIARLATLCESCLCEIFCIFED